MSSPVDSIESNNEVVTLNDIRPFIDEDPQIQIGNRLLPSRYFLAPLAGYTQLPFRSVIRSIGGMGLATTDLVQANHLLNQHPRALELIATDEQDDPLSVQIYGARMEVLKEAAIWLAENGYTGVDINMGCPMAKVNSGGGGSRLMCDVDNACHLVGSIVDAVEIPVTVKMRLGWDRDQITAPTLAREFESLGVAAITIHGRTRQQGFHGHVDIEGIRATVEAVENIPVVGNGDVRTVADAFRMRRQTGCQAVAIGRGGMLDPWIFLRIQRASTGDLSPYEPTVEEQVQFLIGHFEKMTAMFGDYSCILFRKFAEWYGARFGIPESLEQRLKGFESVEEFAEIVAEIRQRHGERECKQATALLRVPNGPVERW